jgi:hypothetical protein
MAIQGANPIITRPVRYSGLSDKKSIARIKSKNGPTIHVINKEVQSSFPCLNIDGTSVKSTLVSGGYIIIMSPTANGILVEPEENELIQADESGIKYPRPTPVSMAKKIHKVR